MTQEFERLLMSLDIEPNMLVGDPKKHESDQLLMIVPRMPSKEVQDMIINQVPMELQPIMVEGMWYSTKEIAEKFFMKYGIYYKFPHPSKISRNFVINLPEIIDLPETCWDDLGRILKADKFLDSYEIICNGETVLYFNRMVAKQTRPEGRTISKDEILNLKIALGACDSVDDFINSI